MKKNRASAVTLLVLAALVAGCEHEDRVSAVTSSFGSDRFSAGGMVSLIEPVQGDAILAGGQVQTASEVKGDLVVAGGEVSVGGGVGDDLYAAGGDVAVDAIVAGNARVAGGEVAIGPATTIAGGASVTGGPSVGTVVSAISWLRMRRPERLRRKPNLLQWAVHREHALLQQQPQHLPRPGHVQGPRV